MREQAEETARQKRISEAVRTHWVGDSCPGGHREDPWAQVLGGMPGATLPEGTPAPLVAPMDQDLTLRVPEESAGCSGLNAPQPPPANDGGPPVWPLVIADLAQLGNVFPRVRTLMEADMRERDAEGRRKYGVPLVPDNGRDALVDAYQESLDLCVYLKQELLRAKGAAVIGAYADAMKLAATLRGFIWARDGLGR